MGERFAQVCADDEGERRVGAEERVAPCAGEERECFVTARGAEVVAGDEPERTRVA